MEECYQHSQERVKFDVLLYPFFTLHDNSWQRTDAPYKKLCLLLGSNGTIVVSFAWVQWNHSFLLLLNKLMGYITILIVT